MTDSRPEPPPRPSGREWLALGVLVLPALLVSLDLSILLVALPQISEQLSAGSTEQLWIADVYGFVVAGLLVTAGTLGDRLGRRRLLIFGGAAFGILSVVAAFSTGPAMLIVCRALLGVAGATLMPSAMALAGGLFPDPKRAGMAMSVVFSAIMAGGALGPVVGGVLLNSFWWGSVFLVAVPVMIVLVVVGPKVLPEFSNPEAGRLDLASVALSLGAILFVVFGVKELAKDGLGVVPVAAIVVGVVLGVVFTRRQSRLEAPLFDVALFRDRAFSAAVVFMLVGGVVMGGLFLMATQYLQLVAGLSPLLAGLAMLVPSLASSAGVLYGPKLAMSVRPAYVMAAGMVVAATGLLIVVAVITTGHVLLVVAGLTVALFGMGLPGGLGLGMIVGAAPPEQAGSASSMSTTCQELGVAFGLALTGSLATVIYAGRLAVDTMAGLPPAVSGAARTSLAQAMAAATDLPAEAGRQLLLSAQESFTTATQVSLGAGAAIAVALAVLVGTALSGVPASGDAPPADGQAESSDTGDDQDAAIGQGTR